jgi:hypothetical protein
LLLFSKKHFNRRYPPLQGKRTLKRKAHST